MICPKCQFDNPEGVKFCGQCGAKLERYCPKCNFSNPPDFKFCGECGHDLAGHKETPIDYLEPHTYTPKPLADKILSSRKHIEGERKLVTILFADVANYTAISEKLDPEDVHKIIDGCFMLLMDEIHRYEGTITQFMGDGVMALFGAPLAHEDHVQRACNAALSIQRAMREYSERIETDYNITFEIRIGLNTGLVIVGSVGDDLKMDYTAIGDTVNLASRMETAARPGAILVSDNVHRIARDYFEFESIGKIALKGKEQPLEASELKRSSHVETRLEASMTRGLTEFVGRKNSIGVLKGAFERAKKGEAQVVDVVGEAGVGKSRLVYEFQKSIGEGVTFLTGICVHYGQNLNFLPVIDVVRAAFGIEEGMTEDEVGERIEETAKEDLVPMIPFYRSLLSLKVDDRRFNSLNPEGRKFGTFEAVKDLLFALSEERPLVLFLEDAHWMDGISEEFFNYFSRSFLDRPILMLSAYRPEGAPPWAQGGRYQSLGLETLGPDSSMKLVRSLLGGLPLEPDLEKKILEKTAGNPFFVEEIVRDLIDRGDLAKTGDRYVSEKPIYQLKIPDTVQGVISARIDRLGENLKRTIQVASVIGRDFAFRLLRSIMELGNELRAHMTNLIGLEILYEKALYPELEYIFKHALIQEVAYESLLKQRRREIHGRIARAIEELYTDRLEQHYELLAHHWELSDSPDRAIEYLVLAGEKSNNNQAVHSAVSFFTEALNQIERSSKAPDPKLMLRIRIGRANPLHTMGRIEEGLNDCNEAIRLAQETGDQQIRLKSLIQATDLIWDTTLKDKAPYYGKQVFKLARRLEEKGAEARIIIGSAMWRYVWQESDEYDTLQKAIKMAERSGQADAIIQAKLVLGLVERWTGNPKRSLELTEGMDELLQSVYSIYIACWFSTLHNWALTDVGRYDESIRSQRKWIDILERNVNYLFLGRCCNGLGWTYSEVYDLENALRFNTRALEHVDTLMKNPANLYSAMEVQAQTEVNLIENRFEMGEIDKALEHLIRFERKSAHPDYDYFRVRWTIRMKVLKGNIMLIRGDLDDAEELALECLETATKRRMKKYMGKAERLLGKIFTTRRQYEQAEEKLKLALERLTEVGNPKQLWITHSALAELYAKTKRPDLERERWNEAASIIESTAEGLEDGELRKTFLAAEPVREIMENAKR